jgi:hypothetical protein
MPELSDSNPQSPLDTFLDAMRLKPDDPPLDPFDYPFESHMAFRHVFLLYFTQPEDVAALEHLGNLAYNMALEYSNKWPDWPESPTRAEMRAVVMDLRHAASFLAGIGEERRHSSLADEDERLCYMASTWAHMVAKIAKAIESVLPRIRGEKAL